MNIYKISLVNKSIMGLMIWLVLVTGLVAAQTSSGAAGKLTLILQPSLDGDGNIKATSITNAEMSNPDGLFVVNNKIFKTATIIGGKAQFDLSGVAPGDYLIRVNDLADDLVPTRIDDPSTAINQFVGQKLRVSVIGNNLSDPTYKIKTFSKGQGKHPVVWYSDGSTLTPERYAYVILSLKTSPQKLEVVAKIAGVNLSGNLENWSAGASAAPDGWAVSGIGQTIARESTIVKTGAYSAKYTSGSGTGALYTDINNSVYYINKPVTLGAWINTSSANKVRIFIQDIGGVGQQHSSYHTGDGTWQFLTKTITPTGGTSILRVGVETKNTNVVTYIDGIILVVSNTGILGVTGTIPAGAEINSYTTSMATHPSTLTSTNSSFSTWMISESGHAYDYNGTDSKCNTCHVNMDTKPATFSDVTATNGWCFRCHYGKGGVDNGFIDTTVISTPVATTVTPTSKLLLQIKDLIPYFILIYFFISLILKLDSRIPIVFALLLLFITAVTLVQGLESAADQIAIYSYYFLVVGVVLQLIEYIRNPQEED